MGEPRNCIVEGCVKKSCNIFNKLCNDHWELLIEENMKRIFETKKEPD